MIIEFIGTPGAGKTTFVPTVQAFFATVGLQAWTVKDAARPFAKRTLAGKLINRFAPPQLRDPLLWRIFTLSSALHRLVFIARNPALVYQVVTAQRRRPAAADAKQRQVSHWFFHHIGYYAFLTAHARPDEVLIFDEGFVHRIVQLHTSSVEEPDPAWIQTYVNRLPRPDLIIHPNTSWQTCEARILSRGLWPRLSHRSPAEISRFVQNAAAAVDLTVSQLAQKGWPIIELNNETPDIDATRARLRRQLAQQLNQADVFAEAGVIA